MEQLKRIEKWDILKFGLIFLVVFGHVLDTGSADVEWKKALILFIYSFHMPLFIFISGLFSKKNIQQKRYDKIISYLFMYFITKIVLAAARVITTGKMSFQILSESGVPWYMFVMFAFSLITIALKNFSPKYIFIFSVVLACLAGYDTSLTDTFCLMRVFVFYPFFYLGYCLEEKDVSKFFDNKKLKIASAIVLVIFAFILLKKADFLFSLRGLLSGRNAYTKFLDSPDFGGLVRLAYYAVAVIIGAAVICITPNKMFNGRVSRLGKRTIQVYTLHYFFIYIYTEFIRSRFLPNHSFIAAVIVSIVITAICSLRFLEPLFSRLMNPVKSKKTPTE